VAVADAFDAMTSDRPYRKALSVAEAVRRLREGAGVQWDPDLVDVFIQLLAEGKIEPATAPEDVAPNAAGIPTPGTEPFLEVER
jgi:putative two-component system response regulator